MGRGVSTNHKSSNRIELSWFIQVLSHFNRLGGTPPGVGGVGGCGCGCGLVGGWWGWLDGGGTLSGCLGGWPMHMCMCTHTHTQAHMREQWCHNGIPQDFPMGAAICMKLSCLYMYACAHMCMRACVHAHMCETPPNTLTESHPHPPTNTPQGVDPWNQSKVNTNLTNQDISILFEDFGSLNTCAFILTTFGVQVGGVLSQIALFTFRPKNVQIFCSCEHQVKNFPVFTLESDRPCLDWQSIWFLTS